MQTNLLNREINDRIKVAKHTKVKTHKRRFIDMRRDLQVNRKKRTTNNRSRKTP